ncbi:MAG: histidinol-phosphate transaminase [Clostridia bacterium]|nr:histidinol-phosphate transaminase [Clostridia bacterium]
MSAFLSKRFDSLTPYVPGEQPQDKKYIKLNTNESPFPPAPNAIDAVSRAVERLALYPDPEQKALTEKTAALCGVGFENVLMTNGSDEALDFAFTAFCDTNSPALFADITYGFYKVYAEWKHVPYAEIPLYEDFTLSVDDYIGKKGVVFIANPNAPTGLLLPVSEIERLLHADTSRLVVVDEAYIDFGGETVVPLIKKYGNLLVIRTFSKSRSMAGARLGFAVGCKALIDDLKKIKYSSNPFNVNALTAAAGIASLENDSYNMENCRTICENREYTIRELRESGFYVTDSKTNFVFAEHPNVSGKCIYEKLKESGILVRRFNTPRIEDYVRITVGTKEQMEILISEIRKITEAQNA